MYFSLTIVLTFFLQIIQNTFKLDEMLNIYFFPTDYSFLTLKKHSEETQKLREQAEKSREEAEKAKTEAEQAMNEAEQRG